MTNRYLVLRVRTRELGATVYDVDQSCQHVYGRWVPYVVFNTSELIDLFSSFQPSPGQITVRRRPVVLDCQNGRFLPKELYYDETGTAETAFLISKVNAGDCSSPVVTIETKSEAYSESSLYRLIRRIARRLL